MSKPIDWHFMTWLRVLWTDLHRAAKIFRAMRQVKKGNLYNPELARLTREQHKLIWHLIGLTLRLGLEISIAIMLILSLTQK